MTKPLEVEAESLKPCPHCGSSAVARGLWAGNWMSVRCMNCDATGPSTKTRVPEHSMDIHPWIREAITAWNRRSPIPSVEAEELEARGHFDPDVLFWAFRYALGRMTYAVSDVAMAIHANKRRLSERMRHRIVLEITEAELRGGLGHDCDIRTWLGVRDALSSGSQPLGTAGEADVALTVQDEQNPRSTAVGEEGKLGSSSASLPCQMDTQALSPAGGEG